MPDAYSYPVWPGWETVRLIGRGSFGVVYEIRREVLGEPETAAMKVMTIPQSDTEVDELRGAGYSDESITATFREYLKDIVAEYSLMRKLNGCSNVVNCDDVRIVEHRDGFGWDIFIKMELLTPLVRALGRNTPEEQVVRIGTDLCRALILCRKHNIVHRDIKPANIFVSTVGDYKLGDFGVARTMERTTGGTKVGTYEYMAPEVYNNQPYGSAADIYSLGMVLYWLLNDWRGPFLPLPPALLTSAAKENARSRRFAGEALPPPAHGGDALRRIVLKACSFDPKGRYQTADDLLADLDALSAAYREKAATESQTQKASPPAEVEDDDTTAASPKAPKAVMPSPKPVNPAPEPVKPVQQPAKPAPEPVKPVQQPAKPVPEAKKVVPEPEKPVQQAVKPVPEPAKPVPEPKKATPEPKKPAPKPAEPAPSPGRPAPAKKKSRLWIAALAAAAVLGLVVFLGSGTDKPHVSASATAVPSEAPTATPSPTAEPVASGECGDDCTWSLSADGVLTIEGSGPMENYLNNGRPPWGTSYSIKSAEIKEGVTSVGNSAFAGLSGLKSISIPDSVTRIGWYAFYGSGLESIAIPDSVTSVGERAFSACTSLTSVTLSNSMTGIGGCAFEGCASLTSITIPDSVTSIDGVAFKDCTSLKSITIPDSVTGIGNTAFSGCASLTSITIPDSVTKIDDGAFSGCTSLTAISIPSSVTSIGDYAFASCTRLTSISIPGSVTSIGMSVFDNCPGLTSVAISDGVTSIGPMTFFKCSGLTSVAIPDSVTSIRNYSFSGCTNLKDVYYSGTEAQWAAVKIGADNTPLTKATIHYNSQAPAAESSAAEAPTPTPSTTAEPVASGECGDDCTWSLSADGVLTIEGAGQMREYDSSSDVPWNDFRNRIYAVTIKAGVTNICNYAFYNCAGLTSIAIPDSVKSIERNAFYNCKALPVISLPGSITSIGDNAFHGCASLKSISIPGSVTSIGEPVFHSCTGLREILVDSSNPAYTAHDGVLFTRDMTTLVCYPVGKTDKSYAIPDGVTSIYSYAFHNCDTLAKISIPDSVKSIGHYSFCSCDGLTEMIIPDSVTDIEYGAFSCCSGIKEVFVSNTNSAFSMKDGVLFNKDQTELLCYPAGKTDKSYAIPNGVKDIRTYAFGGCNNLTSISIPKSVTNIDTYQFCNCSNLQSIKVDPANLSFTSVNGVLFNKDRTKLLCYPAGKTDNSYSIPTGVTSIGSYAFSGCAGLTSIAIPDSVTSFERAAFSSCTGLKDVYYTGTEVQWSAIKIGGNNDPLTKATIHYNS